jgi:hypothetical protein
MVHLHERHRRRRSRFATVLMVALTCGALTFSGTTAIADQPAPTSAVDCGSMTMPIYQRVNPTSTASLLTRSVNEARRAADYGFTGNNGLPFLAAAAPGPGLVGAHRMYLPGRSNFVWMTSPSEIALAKSMGYLDQGTNFYASTAPAPCLIPVFRYYRNGYHRFVVGDVQGAAERSAGWFPEGVAFYAAPPAPLPGGDTTFSIVVYPDTQMEVLSDSDTRIANRTRWLLDNQGTLDARFVIHTGDLVNWDTPGHEQYARASAGLQALDVAGPPYAIAVGNHDTAAVCLGGSASPGQPTTVTVRDTSTVNQYFPVSRFPRMAGQFEPGKIDNSFSTFTAGGRHWLVLTLELWPRVAAVDWARTIVARFSDHNVIVATHSYLEADGSIVQNNGGYGANSPQYVYDRLIRPYPNVRLVFSGHTGLAASRVDTGDTGHSVASFLGGFHSRTTNPLQVVQIDTASNTVSTRWFAPLTGTEYPEFSRTVFGMSWVG